MNAGDIYQKLCNGDHITDQELKFGIKFFKDLADKLRKCGPVFKLAAREADGCYTLLSDFRDSRKRYRG